ncbi:VWA domain-containing protein [Jiella endophytica]|uniref:VWA domain-containing protein n=1 Tax=Jiella endophytica TaxID=2558362 RepID=A0A4Y8RQ94_9HYPH|nr:pilus assembly protein TadG-related protein [Jiella endophytica]TFF25230.1 VWA domain-containing protein [Jiella endophytica]
MTLGEVARQFSYRSVKRAIRRFARSSAGNFGIMVGLAAIPLVLAIGGVVDYSNALRVRTSLQSAADAAALAAAKYSGSDENERTARANRFFNANADPEAKIQTTALKKVDNAWLYQADFSMPTAFLGLMHIEELDMEVKATAKQADVPLDIALVLDSTGSMASSGKMAQLKASVKLFLSNFGSSAGVNNVQVAMIPFDTNVRVSSLNMAMLNAPVVNCSYMSSPDKDYCGTTTPGFAMGTTSGYYYAGKSGSRYIKYVYTALDTLTGSLKVDRATYSCSGSNYNNCSVSTSTIYNRSYSLSTASGTWSGCVNDRKQPYDTTAAAATASNTDTLYMRAANCSESASLQPVVGLTKDLDGLATKVDSLTPSGNTNITVGVQWGMEALTSAYPLQGKSTDAKTKAIMIVLTDGDNTEDRWYTSSDSSSIDARTKLACTNAKAMTNPDGTKLEIYTIRVIDGNESLLKSCATDNDHYFSVTDSSQLQAVFQAIAEQVKRIRIIS